MLDVMSPFTMERFRLRLRAEREARIGGREALAEKAGLAKTTIQNAEMGPDIPGIDTVARMIEAMPELTLSAFFRQLELNEVVASVSIQAPLVQAVLDDPDAPPLQPLPPEGVTLRAFLRDVGALTITESESEHRADRRLATAIGAQAAEYGAPTRARDRRHAVRKKKKRPRKQ